MQKSGKPVGAEYNLLDKEIDIDQRGRNYLNDIGKGKSERPWRNSASDAVC